MRWFWVDRFSEFVSGSHAVAVKAVSLAEEHLHDHHLGYPLMPNSLVTEGVAQTGGLLVSEYYGFSELVVLAKISKAAYRGEVLAGSLLTYRIKADWIRSDSAQVSATVSNGSQDYGEVELMFARIGEEMAPTGGVPLFRPRDLEHWLHIVGIFEVGVKPDGTRLRRSDYPLQESAEPARA